MIYFATCQPDFDLIYGIFALKALCNQMCPFFFLLHLDFQS